MSAIQQIEKDLYLIHLPVPIQGFDGFVGAWVYTAGPVVLIDAGPEVSASYLLAALAEIGVRQLDLILLTHIHIDHAGGAGTVSTAFPQTPVVCHPKGLGHMADPERLWQGSLKTLGSLAHSYGPIGAVDANRLLAADQLNTQEIVSVPTPGHAPHHYSYLMGDRLFAGEAGGICLPLDTGQLYLRPATPPRFFLETYLESVDRLVALQPRTICYGHLGQQDNAVDLLNTHRDQLLRWHEMIRPWFEEAPKDALRVMHACRDHLLANEPLLDGFGALSPDEQARESNFILNTIKGFWGYLSTV